MKTFALATSAACLLSQAAANQFVMYTGMQMAIYFCFLAHSLNLLFLF